MFNEERIHDKKSNSLVIYIFVNMHKYINKYYYFFSTPNCVNQLTFVSI